MEYDQMNYRALLHREQNDINVVSYCIFIFSVKKLNNFYLDSLYLYSVLHCCFPMNFNVVTYIIDYMAH